MAEEERGNQRYLAFVNRFRFLANLKRYLAYTSDLGQAFRPIANPYIVTGTYLISWGYVLVDSHLQASAGKNKEKAKLNYYRNLAKQLIFQGVASMLLPATSIFLTVRSTSWLLAKTGAQSKGVKFLPVLCGLGIIPFFPAAFDHPVEHRVFEAFDKYFPEKEPPK